MDLSIAFKNTAIIALNSFVIVCGILAWNIYCDTGAINGEISFINTRLLYELQESHLMRTYSIDLSEELTVCCCQSDTNHPTLTPSYYPTFTPTGLPIFIATLNPSLIPTVSPSYVPTYTPTVAPSYVPTYTPTSSIPTTVPSPSPSVVPSQAPTPVPSFTPTRTPTGFQGRVIESSKNGTTGSDIFIIDSVVNVELRGNGGDDLYVIHSFAGRDITIVDFSEGTNKIDLSEGFPKITSYQEINERFSRVESNALLKNGISSQSMQGRLTLTLPDNQYIILLNIPSSFSYSEDSFKWASPEGENSLSKTGKSNPNISALIGAIVGAVSGPAAVCAFFYNAYRASKGFEKYYNLKLLEYTFENGGLSSTAFLSCISTVTFLFYAYTAFISRIHLLTAVEANGLKDEFINSLNCNDNTDVIAVEMQARLKNFFRRKNLEFTSDELSAIAETIRNSTANGGYQDRRYASIPDQAEEEGAERKGDEAEAGNNFVDIYTASDSIARV
jgi:hypothetical protein